ncbi:hypothetical protein ACWOFR_17785 [Carnobacterium gallinarum]|uniref:hypothetical protein n=1 Tax=Carnobacterium gallinarum TaxID=2749 RepID=UPI0005559781|nr:hypothetical protein [Carnobacterium gallinarum]
MERKPAFIDVKFNQTVSDSHALQAKSTMLFLKIGTDDLNQFPHDSFMKSEVKTSFLNACLGLEISLRTITNSFLLSMVRIDVLKYGLINTVRTIRADI